MRRGIDILDRVIGQLLDFDLEPLALVLTDVVLFLVDFQMIHSVTADVAHRDSRLFGILAGQLGQFLAPFLSQIGDRQTDHRSIGNRVEAQPGRADRFFDRTDIALVPHLDRQQPRLRDRHRRNLVQGHLRAIDFDIDRIEQGGGGTTGAKPDQIILQRFQRAAHPALKVGLVIGGHVLLSILNDCRNSASGEHLG